MIKPEILNFNDTVKWIFAKTMANIPHEYIIRGSLSQELQKLFDEFAEYINKKGYEKQFFTKTYKYINIADYKYWVIEDIINRAKTTKEKK